MNGSWSKVQLLLLLLLLPEINQTPLDLDGVPDHLKQKILDFQKVLSAPDNFSVTPAPTEAPRYGLAGLQEVGEGEEISAPRTEPGPDLHEDLFRFSGKLSAPTDSNIYARIVQTKERRKARMEREWRQFLKWRKKQRKRKRIRRRIMRMLKKKIEKRFGPISTDRWTHIKKNRLFQDKKNIIKQKVRLRIKQTRVRSKLKANSRNQQDPSTLPKQRNPLKRRRQKNPFRKRKRFGKNQRNHPLRNGNNS